MSSYIVLVLFRFLSVTGNERAILLFLLFESAILLILAALVSFCCIFWKKKKLQGQDLGKFLEKRVSSKYHVFPLLINFWKKEGHFVLVVTTWPHERERERERNS